MGRASGGLNKIATESFNAVVGQTRGLKRNKGKLEPELANKVTYLLDENHDGLYLGQTLVWQGHSDELTIEPLLTILNLNGITFEVVDLDLKGENKVMFTLPNNEETDDPYAKDGNSFLSRIKNKKETPVIILTTSIMLGVYYKGKRIWQGNPEGLEMVEDMFEKLPLPFSMVRGFSYNGFLEEGQLPETIPVWLVRGELE